MSIFVTLLFFLCVLFFEHMQLVEYLTATLLGTTMSIGGAGASVLSVPFLMNALGLPATIASEYSVLLMGATSLVGASNRLKKFKKSIHQLLYFAVPSILSIFGLGYLKSLPQIKQYLNDSTLNSYFDNIKMSGFVVIIVITLYQLVYFKNKKLSGNLINTKLILTGLASGSMTAMIGASANTLLLPTALLLNKKSPKKAIPVSLLMVSINSLTACINIKNWEQFDWSFLSIVAACTILGIFIGNQLLKLIKNLNLLFVFITLLLVMLIYYSYKTYFMQ